MGLTQSKTDVSTEINQSVFNELLNQISTSGSSAGNDQQTTVSGLNVVMVGNENCKEHPTITINNESQMKIDNMIDIAAKSFADTLASLKASVDNTKGVDSALFGDSGNTTIKTASNATIKNAIESIMNIDCGKEENYQKINVKDSLMDLTCASLDISNKNIQQASCIMKSISDVTSKLDGEMDTSVKNDIGNNDNIVIIFIIIAVIIIVIIIIVIIVVVSFKGKAVGAVMNGVAQFVGGGNNGVPQTTQTVPQTGSQTTQPITHVTQPSSQPGSQPQADLKQALVQFTNGLKTIMNNGNYQGQYQNVPT